MPARKLNERKSLTLDDDVGLDQQGYVLQEGNNGGEVRKTEAATDVPLGVNYVSTLNADDSYVKTGVEAAVIHDGYPLVLCEPGFNYTSGDAVYVADPANSTSGQNGTASANADPAGDGTITPTKLGNVVPGAGKDLTGSSELELVQVDITSNLGDS